MIDFAAIRTAIVSGLSQYLGVPVVMLEQKHPKPPYPFVGYKFTSPFIPERGQPAETMQNVPSSDPNFEYDVEVTQKQQPTMVLSVTAYSDDSDACHALALNAHSWFDLIGYEELRSSGIIVVRSGNIQNRDTLIVGDYERRQGFDVSLRVSGDLKLVLPTIEKVEITKAQ